MQKLVCAYIRVILDNHNVLLTYDALENLGPIINLPDYTAFKAVTKGDATMLMCVAHGRSKISYHWEYRANKSNKWMAISEDMDSGLLILSNFAEDDEGIYRCVACDCYSCTYSTNTTTITVIGKITFEFSVIICCVCHTL